MRIAVLSLAAVAFGLLAGTASACPYNQAVLVQQVVATPVAVQTVVPVQAAVVTPYVQSQVAVVPVQTVFATPVFVNQNVYGHGGFSSAQFVQQRGFSGQRAVGGGGLIGGVGGAVSNVIGAVGNVLNSPAGLTALGAGIAGAGPLGFLGGGGRGNGGGFQQFANFNAAVNRGANPQAAAAFAASQRGRR